MINQQCNAGILYTNLKLKKKLQVNQAPLGLKPLIG